MTNSKGIGISVGFSLAISLSAILSANPYELQSRNYAIHAQQPRALVAERAEV